MSTLVMTRLRLLTLLGLLACLSNTRGQAWDDAAAASPAARPAVASAGSDWTYWRGPQMNGNSTETGLIDSWDPEGGEGSNLLWKKPELGTRSTPIVMNGRLYVICRDKPFTEDEREKLVCLDAASGDLLWEQAWNAYLTEVPDTRLAWSAVVGDPETGHVYALGVCGVFTCFNGESGKIVWQHSLHEEYGLLSTYGGRTNFPIIHEDNVIISAVITGWGTQTKPTHRYIAFDKKNGEAAWFEGTRPLPEDTTYSAPVLGVFDGQATLVFGAGDGGVYGFQPRTGKKLWSYELSERGVNTSPVIYKDYVLCGHSEENTGTTSMGGMVCLNGKDGTEVWKRTEMFVGKSPPIVAGDLIVAIEDGGKLMIVDPETGKTLFNRKVDTVMRGSPLYADGKLYVMSANGRWWIFRIKSTGEGDQRKVSLEQVHNLRLMGDDGSTEEGLGSPIVARGRLYLPTTNALYCIGKADATPQGGELPPVPAESPREEDQTPALVQVVPVEGLLLPGDLQPLEARLYNARGQWLRNARPDEVTYTVDGVGTVEPRKLTIRAQDASGQTQTTTIDHPHVYGTDAALRTHSAGIITAKVGELTGTSRMRVVPNLPWSFDFNDGVIPVTWVSMSYRHVPLDFDLHQDLAKVDPLVAQLYIYFWSEFVNFAPKRSFDDSTNAKRWTELLRMFNLLDEGKRPKNLEEARKLFNPWLDKLVEVKVLKSYTWSTWERSDSSGQAVLEPKLEIERGERGIEGNGVICKLQTIPKGTRSQGFCGHTQFHDYTIQADVFSPGKNGKLPDIGLVAQRYTLDLLSANQQAQIRSWQAQLYHSKSVPFNLEADTWYTMKFTASTDGNTAHLKGKVWKRGETEPEEWTVSVSDPIGNLKGTPGFYGSAKDAEIFYDNVTVTPNGPGNPDEGKVAGPGE